MYILLKSGIFERLLCVVWLSKTPTSKIWSNGEKRRYDGESGVWVLLFGIVTEAGLWDNPIYSIKQQSQFLFRKLLIYKMARCVAVVTGDGITGNLMFYQVCVCTKNDKHLMRL